MPQNSCEMCCECDAEATELCNLCRCQRCCCWICAKCGHQFKSPVVFEQGDVECMDYSHKSVKSCKLCHEASMMCERGRQYCVKVHPSVSPQESPEPPSPWSVNSESVQNDHFSYHLEARDCGYSPHAVTSSSITSFGAHLSPVSTGRSPSRSEEEDAEDSEKNIGSTSVEFGQEASDIESGRGSARHEFLSFNAVCSSPSVSPSRNSFTPCRDGHSVQWRQEGSRLARNNGLLDHERMAILKRLDQGSEKLENLEDYSHHMSFLQNQNEKSTKPLDFENNGLMWYPPPPEDENDDADSNFFSYDDDEDDVGAGANFSSTSCLSSVFSAKEKQSEESKEPIKAVIQGHFRALVLQLLQGEGIEIGKDDCDGDWLDIVTTIAWQAASFVKPDTRRGGSMDPSDYVKVKCIASGIPSESALIKGVVCTKNIKHKRMASHYKNPKLFILEGALEFHKVPNQLASFNTLLEQEHNHLKVVIGKIEALHPNVLLVEKSVSSYAQEYLLAKEISLVLNVKRSVLERIAMCTGAHICPSIDKISTTRLGCCELFRLEKVSEEHETANQLNKKPSKTLMFFEGCPRRLGCTILLRGKSREELKKVKHVVQYAVFAGYHLSLETSFLADEGATLPKMKLRQSTTIPDCTKDDKTISPLPSTHAPYSFHEIPDTCQDLVSPKHNLGHGEPGMLPEYHDRCPIFETSHGSKVKNHLYRACNYDLEGKVGVDMPSFGEFEDGKDKGKLAYIIREIPGSELQETMAVEMRPLEDVNPLAKYEGAYEDEVSGEYLSATDTHQSILVSFSSRSVLRGTVCERSRLLRIKFYGCFDKPLGRYLCDDLFNQTFCCVSCKEPTEAHVICYTHHQGNLTINVRRLSSIKLPGENDGKIWMWHRCLRCAHIDGVPPATRRVIMSDAAWGLSFGKFLELSFSDHATANRVASCGHSLQRDCLRYYGYGSMVAFFRYSPIDIHSVHLPPSVLEFDVDVHQDWIGQQTAELVGKMESLYGEIADVLDRIEQKSKSMVYESSNASEVHTHMLELKHQLCKERDDYRDLLQPISRESSQVILAALDILELNHVRRELLICSHVWDCQLHSLDSLLKKGSTVKAAEEDDSFAHIKESSANSSMDGKVEYGHEENISMPLELNQPSGTDAKSELEDLTLAASESIVPENFELASCHQKMEDHGHSDGGLTCSKTLHESITSPGSALSDIIHFAWTGNHLSSKFQQPLEALEGDGLQAGSNSPSSKIDSPPLIRIALPIRVHSLDSAFRFQERIKKGLPPSSLHLSTLKSFHASGDYRIMVRDPTSIVARTNSQTLPLKAQKLNLLLSRTPTFIFSAHHIAGGARLLLPQRDSSAIVIAVYDNDPASIISYALISREHEEWVSDKSDEDAGRLSVNERNEDSTSSTVSAWQSFGSLDINYVRYTRYSSEDVSSSAGVRFSETKRSPHVTVSFGDDTATAGGHVKFSVTCYFAKQFDSLRKKCCSSEVDILRSLSRCQKWSAQGGKSNVYFGKTLDERFIIKQVQKTELESFVEFAPEYFKYLTDSLTSGSPTCLAKVLGIYQVSVKHLKSGKETKMDLMIMENLFFGRSISRVYDLKGSARSRYNPDTTGANKVLLDMNLLETLRTERIFLGSKAKRSLERAIWNDTSFLASVDVMDYSLLVGVDNECKELVLGIIDFMRQFTWDKQLETWVKASGILGGPKNTSPTIISPKQYKKRFRKAMTTYFLTLPDQWTS